MKTSATQIRAKAAVYAQTLLDAAKASDRVLTIAGEFDDLRTTVRGSIELRKTLTDRTLPEDTKRAIVAELFVGFSPELLAVFNVMVEREDLAVLPRVNEVYRGLAEEALGATIIDVTTVVELDDALRDQIVSKYSAELGTGILLREHTDPSLIGGIVLSTHGKRIDASVLSQLESARHVLSKAY